MRALRLGAAVILALILALILASGFGLGRSGASLTATGNGSVFIRRAPAAKPSTCRDTFHSQSAPPAKIDLDQTTTHIYTAVEMAYHDKWIQKDLDSGRRKIVFFIPESNRGRVTNFDDIEIMPGAADDSSSYYAKFSMDHSSNHLSGQLYSIHQTAKLSKLVNQSFELTWDTYRKMNVVSEEEIEQFKRTEDDLAPQRKVNMVTTAPDGRVVAVLRIYDGSPFPAAVLGDHPTHLEAPASDPRLPIERRYPHLNFRSTTNYIFEAGRFAKVQDIANILEYQLHHIGSYFISKFGALMVGPSEYMHKGRMYVEITGLHLSAYMTPVEQGGLGFRLSAMALDGGEMTEVSGQPTFASLKRKRRDPGGKFILYKDVVKLINDHYMTVQLAPAAEAHPDRFR